MMNKKNILSIGLVAALLLGLAVTMKLAGQRQDIRNRAAGLSGTVVSLKLDPNPAQIAVNGETVFQLKATFTGGSDLEKLGYFYTEVSFDKNYLKVPVSTSKTTAYIDTSSSQLGNIMRVSTSADANTNGKIKIELGADSKSTGPKTSKEVLLATIRLKGVKATNQDENKSISMTNTQVVNNNSSPTELSVSPIAAKYQVTGSSGNPTATPNQSVPTATPKPGSSKAILWVKPGKTDIANGTSTDYTLVAQFQNGAADKKLDYFKTELTFPKEFIEIPTANPYVSTVDSGFNRIWRVDSNIAANQNGKIVIEIGTDQPGTGPVTDKDLTIAKWKMKGIAATSSSQSIAIGTTEMVWFINNQAEALIISPQNASFNVTGGSNVTPTTTPGDSRPTSTPTTTPGDSGPTVTPTIYQPTVKPTPPSDRSLYIIDIGDKQSLTLDIGKGTEIGGVQIKFKTILADVQGHPDLFLRLRVKDELAFLNNPQDDVSSGDSCKNPPASEKDFWIPVKADGNGVYSPDASAVPYASANAKTMQNNKASAMATDVMTAPVSPDGWVTLDGLFNDRYYSLFLKGPKTKATRTAEHVIWQGGPQSLPEFDWTAEELALQPGDLMDPNSNYEQNCTVNSIDLALIEDRLAKTDTDSLRVADVNYDGVVNGNDISKVVHTLSTKPDDDH